LCCCVVVLLCVCVFVCVCVCVLLCCCVVVLLCCCVFVFVLLCCCVVVLLCCCVVVLLCWRVGVPLHCAFVVERASWPAPVVSFTAESNAAVTSGYSVTVSGISFSIGALTATATVGHSSCGTAAWASSTSLVCMAAIGEATAHAVRVTAGGAVGTRTSSFSYDGEASPVSPSGTRPPRHCTLSPAGRRAEAGPAPETAAAAFAWHVRVPSTMASAGGS